MQIVEHSLIKTLRLITIYGQCIKKDGSLNNAKHLWLILNIPHRQKTARAFSVKGLKPILRGGCGKKVKITDIEDNTVIFLHCNYLTCLVHLEKTISQQQTTHSVIMSLYRLQREASQDK